MSTAIAVVVGGVILTLALAWLLFVVAMRVKFRPVQDRVRRMNRALANPEKLKTAGQPGSRTSVVRHVGRKTGAPYRTPVVAATAAEGFVIALPYGSGADWVQNVLAAGAATLENDGDSYRVERPQFVPATVAQPCFPRWERWEHRVYGVDDFLLLRHAHRDGG
jgi:deazaflavin-dependent oxidoreductase (nitroreductase family)